MSMRLSVTNPHLRNPATRTRSVLRSVATSSAIEGIRAPFVKKASKASGKSAVTLKRKVRTKR